MADNKKQSVKTRLTDAGFTVKGLRILLAFSFVATVLAFSVAYLEHRQYTELVGRYDDAMVRISECEASVEALINNAAVPEELTQITVVTTTAPITEETESTSFTYTEQTTTQKSQEATIGDTATSHTTAIEQTTKETTTAVRETSSTYYVTQSGKKYHMASCSYLNKSKISITMDRIKAEGYSPCSRCIK